MTENTINAIHSLLLADPENDPQQTKAILAACRKTGTRRATIMAKEAMRILGIRRPTLHSLVVAGKLAQINPTPRKTRFFLDEVENLAYTAKGI